MIYSHFNHPLQKVIEAFDLNSNAGLLGYSRTDSNPAHDEVIYETIKTIKSRREKLSLISSNMSALTTWSYIAQ